MDNYLKENRNPIEYREIQEHFFLGRLDLARFPEECRAAPLTASHPYGKLRRSTALLVDWIWRGNLAIPRPLFPLWGSAFNQGI